MDIATIVGLVLALGLMIFSIMTGEKGVMSIMAFLHGPSAMITFGGAFASVMAMCNGIPDFVAKLKSITLATKAEASNEAEKIKQIIELSNVARKDGLLQLEEAANSSIDDEFMKKGILLIVDGTDPEFVRSILETELECINTRHKEVIGFWENLASMGPAWGMIGTLIGLVNMLKTLSDPDSIGPQMAVALLTTLYGSLIANWLCTPISYKLKSNDALEVMMKEITIEGLLSIQAGENPRVIEEKLKSFLAPKVREEMLGQQDEFGGGE